MGEIASFVGSFRLATTRLLGEMASLGGSFRLATTWLLGEKASLGGSIRLATTRLLGAIASFVGSFRLATTRLLAKLSAASHPLIHSIGRPCATHCYMTPTAGVLPPTAIRTDSQPATSCTSKMPPGEPPPGPRRAHKFLLHFFELINSFVAELYGSRSFRTDHCTAATAHRPLPTENVAK